DGNEDGKAGQRGVDRLGVVGFLRKTRGDHCRYSDDGSRRQIDAAGDDYLCDADGDDADDRHLEDDDPQALRIHEEALPDEDPAEHFEDEGEADEDAEDADFGRQPALRSRGRATRRFNRLTNRHRVSPGFSPPRALYCDASSMILT